ncbi:hypothetical protein EJ02DRAFT_467003 [Clathrospora elynae]|uniref:Uncharacterized protein n=1 Tax=Clathrospora elynae TaxID=706981 RepID=A0A6A5SN02_9PLEO|nr:hypothetical protein EJ02DRAFT_467003 [Clathrospora elynae]
MGHDGTPVMLLEPNSPEMREPSYVEQSMRILSDYIAKLPQLNVGTSMGSCTDSQPSSRASSVPLLLIIVDWGSTISTYTAPGGSSCNHIGTILPPPLPQHHYQQNVHANPYYKPPHTPISPQFPTPNSYTDKHANPEFGPYYPQHHIPRPSSAPSPLTYIHLAAPALLSI